MNYKIVTHARPMIDTGIGQEMGFDSDRAFLNEQRRERETLDPAVARALDDAQRAVERRTLLGDGS